MRCSWADGDPLLEAYHDTEWGMPLHDDGRQAEYLSMEVMQCGLSWMTVLRKREVLRNAFSDYSRRKILAIIKNAKAFLQIQEAFGSFSAYLWHFTDGKPWSIPDTPTAPSGWTITIFPTVSRKTCMSVVSPSSAPSPSIPTCRRPASSTITGLTVFVINNSLL
jgi:3-methyladenine DNA glycosylase Tag